MKFDAHEVDKNLWVGATPTGDADVRGFDLVVLAAEERQPQLYGTRVLRVPLDDAKPSEEDVRKAWAASQIIAAARSRGANVLIACNMGINRSSWIAAMVLMRSGMTADQAIRRIRWRRKHPLLKPLSNPYFVEVLHALDAQRQGASASV